MGKLSAGARRKKTPPQPAVRVVYITSPLKVTATTASEFRALVQKLTGRDSGAASDIIANYVTPAAEEEESGFCSPAVAPAAGLSRVSGCDVKVENSLVAPMEVFDEAAAFDAEMLESFSSFVSYLSKAL